MKTKDELNHLKKEFENLNGKLSELTDDELTQVTGGINDSTFMKCDLCGFKAVWEGNYVDEVFDCKCGRHSLKGMNLC